MVFPRELENGFITPAKQVYAGLWTLFAGATVFLALRYYCKLIKRHVIWYDDWILLLCWLILLATDAVITEEFATGYVIKKWDDRMHILINISSCGTALNQVLTKTAFAVTLMRITNKWQRGLLVVVILSLNLIAVLKVVMTWAKQCDKDNYQQWYRIQGMCVSSQFVANLKNAGNIWNIVTDFVLAIFPWMVVWKLQLTPREKLALCVPMSLGIVVAIVAAIRTWWMNLPIMDVHDTQYFVRQGLSMVWYSSEVTGTIIVQCIPLLRPLIRDVVFAATSQKISSWSDWASSATRKRASARMSLPKYQTDGDGNVDGIAVGPRETTGMALGGAGIRELKADENMRMDYGPGGDTGQSWPSDSLDRLPGQPSLEQHRPSMEQYRPSMEQHRPQSAGGRAPYSRDSSGTSEALTTPWSPLPVRQSNQY